MLSVFFFFFFFQAEDGIRDVAVTGFRRVLFRSEERAAALFKDLPVAVEAAGEPQAATPFAASATASSVAPAAPAPPSPVIPTPVRPKPVASATPGAPVPPPPPRPVASAAPGAIPLEERRREKGKKRKKGKKSLVDQEAVAQNISRTLASIKGPVGRKGVHRREEGPGFPAPGG